MKKLVLLTVAILLSFQMIIGQNTKEVKISCTQYAGFVFNKQTGEYDIQSERNLVTHFILKQDWSEISYKTSEGSHDRIVRFGSTSVDNVKESTSFQGRDRSGRVAMVILDIRGMNIRIIGERYGEITMSYFPIDTVE